MSRGQRTERLIRIAARLINSPSVPLSLTAMSEDFGVSKTVISDDVAILGEALALEGVGKLVVDRGRTGGAYFQPNVSLALREEKLGEIARELEKPHRQLPSNFIYYADLLFNPQVSDFLGLAMATLFSVEKPTIIMTSEVKGIPLGMSTARAMGVPLAVCRFRNRASDGPAVCVHYPTPAGEARAVYMGTKLLNSEDRVLIIDDFVRGGSTIAGMCQVVGEFGSEIVGIGAFIMAQTEKRKAIDGIKSLLRLEPDKRISVTDEALEIHS